MDVEGCAPVSDTVKTMVAFANLPKVLEAAQFLADMGVLREADVNKCVRVYVSKHPEINAHLKTLSPTGTPAASLHHATSGRDDASPDESK